MGFTVSKTKWQRLAEKREQQLAQAVTEKRDLAADLERERNRHDKTDQELADARATLSTTRHRLERSETNKAQLEIKLFALSSMIHEWVNAGHGTISEREISTMRIRREDREHSNDGEQPKAGPMERQS